MALQIDDDWKRQAQEEKRRLAEESKAREAAAKPPAVAPAAADAAADPRRARALPAADFPSLVSTMITQASYALGDYADGANEPAVDLDGAKFQLDLLAVVEEKTKGNLTPAEQALLDSALYEVRSRWVSVATAMIR